MDLEEYCSKLSEEQKLNLATRLIKIALPVWDKFADKNKLTYRDSVVWLKHKVDKDIIRNVVLEIENNLINSDYIKKLKNNEILLKYFQDFSDTIIVIQDDDWKLPYAVEKIFYSVYNLLSAITGGNEDTSEYYLAINQAIDAIDNEKIMPEEAIKSLLKSSS